MATKKSSQPLKVGDRVKILHSGNLRARIVELRGPLGPGGMFVYRVRIPDKPKPTYIELCADQLVPIPTPPKVGPSPLMATPRPELHSPQIKPRKRQQGQ